MAKRKTAGTSRLQKANTGKIPEPRIMVLDPMSQLPFSLNTHELTLSALLGQITPPPDGGRDRTRPDKDRFRDRGRGKLDKEKLKDIIKNNPVFGDKGKVKVPVDGGKEPRWRPGRDGQGGGGKGRKGGKDPGDLIYVDMDMDEFIQWLFEDLELPFMYRKDKATMLVKTHRMRGLTTVGPEVRVDWEETAIKRIERAIGMFQADPERFALLDEDTLKLFGEAIARLTKVDDCPVPAATLSLAADAVAKLASLKAAALPLDPSALSALDACVKLFKEKRNGYPELDNETDDRVTRAVSALLSCPEKYPLLDPETDIPSERDVPYQDLDFVYRRVETNYDPDSKAVVFLVLDRSGSMGGEPLAIAKFYFLLNILFLRNKYKTVEVVMVAHDAQAYEIKDERNFYQIEVAGGTMFVPAYEMVYGIATERYPASSWNRYMFHATDGYMFDGDDEITDWWARLIKTAADCGSFSFAGYLEIDPWAGRSWRSGQWAPGGMALMNLPAEIKRHVGMAHVSSMDEVLDAFKAILAGDKVQEA